MTTTKTLTDDGLRALCQEVLLCDKEAKDYLHTSRPERYRNSSKCRVQAPVLARALLSRLTPSPSSIDLVPQTQGEE